MARAHARQDQDGLSDGTNRPCRTADISLRICSHEVLLGFVLTALNVGAVRLHSGSRRDGRDQPRPELPGPCAV